MNSLILYGHGGSGNHGCEAIVRSTHQICLHSHKINNFFLATPKLQEDQKYGLDNYFGLHDVSIRKKNLDFYLAYIGMKLTGNYAMLDNYPYFEFARLHHDAKIALSIGGDNYCYNDNKTYAILNKIFCRAGHKTILWGCSIEPESMKSEDLLSDLRRYSHIVARESITYEALKSSGLQNVSLYPDPAFTLEPEFCELPHDIPIDNTVAINISPMIINCEGSKDVTLMNYRHVIHYILDKTDMHILLVPHVVWSNNDDRLPLTTLYEQFSNSGRVHLLADHSAPKLKYAISKCRFAIVARTHASIAAYSSGVPTLVIGYSVKARGIARDIFGTDKHYVVPVQSLTKESDLLQEFHWLVQNENQIRSHYSQTMRAYIDRAWQSGEVLTSLLKRF